MIYRSILFLALAAAPAVADQIKLSNSLRPQRPTATAARSARARNI